MSTHGVPLTRNDNFWEAPRPPSDFYPTIEAAKAALKQFAIEHLFAVTTRRSYHGHARMQCFRGRLYEQHSSLQDEDRQRTRGSYGTNCPYDVRIHPVEIKPKEYVYVMEARYSFHNHPPMNDRSNHIDGRRLTAQQVKTVAALTMAEVPAGKILTALQDNRIVNATSDVIESDNSDVEVVSVTKRRSIQSGSSACQLLSSSGSSSRTTINATRRDIYNIRREAVSAHYGNNLPMEALFRDLDNRLFHHEHALDEHNRLKGLFITNETCIQLAKTYGRVLIMDCTYKTNKFGMPLFNVISFDCNYKTFTVAWFFLQQEQKENYLWALERLRDMLHPMTPNVILTDREQALTHSLARIFPNVPQLLCLWHINKNIYANCRRHFPNDDAWKLFEKAVQGVIYAPTVELYADRIYHLESRYSHGRTIRAWDYLEELFHDWKQLFCLAYSQPLMTFGTKTTGRVEGNHGILKQKLPKCQSTINGTVTSLCDTLMLQQKEQKELMSKVQDLLPIWVTQGAYPGLFGEVVWKVSHHALEIAKKEYTKASKDIQEGNLPPIGQCHCQARTDLGIPCRHLIYHHRRDMMSLIPLSINDFASHWHLPEAARPVSQAAVLPPAPVPRPTTINSALLASPELSMSGAGSISFEDSDSEDSQANIPTVPGSPELTLEDLDACMLPLPAHSMVSKPATTTPNRRDPQSSASLPRSSEFPIVFQPLHKQKRLSGQKKSHQSSKRQEKLQFEHVERQVAISERSTSTQGISRDGYVYL